MPTVDHTHRERPYGIPPPAFRLPEKTHVGVVRLQVSDLRRSSDYYQRVLGFRVEQHSADAAALSPREDDRVLVWLHTHPGVMPAPRGAFGLYHFAILLADRAALGQFAAHLSRLHTRVAMADHRVSEALYLWDPDGLGIEVYADRPPETWEHQGRQLVMTTDPLDVSNLIAAGHQGAWDGIPAATTIGHVHLNVGSLEKAEGFYHRALGFDTTVWDYPGALFFSAGGYHHHVGTNTWSPGPSATEDQARLLEWELVVPSVDDRVEGARSLRASGYTVAETDQGCTTTDPWGTQLRIVADK